jgi:hypothetical protein
MANALYDKGRENILGGDIDWDAATIKAVLTRHSGDTPIIATDDALDDISAGTAATSAALATKTKTDGVAGAADDPDFFPAVTAGAACNSVSLYKDTGTPSTSLLICFIDTAGATLPVTPNGGDIGVTWDSGANKIFKL